MSDDDNVIPFPKREPAEPEKAKVPVAVAILDAIYHYENHCKRDGVHPTPAGRVDAVDRVLHRVREREAGLMAETMKTVRRVTYADAADFVESYKLRGENAPTPFELARQLRERGLEKS